MALGDHFNISAQPKTNDGAERGVPQFLGQKRQIETAENGEDVIISQESGSELGFEKAWNSVSDQAQGLLDKTVDYLKEDKGQKDQPDFILAQKKLEELGYTWGHDLDLPSGKSPVELLIELKNSPVLKKMKDKDLVVDNDDSQLFEIKNGISELERKLIPQAMVLVYGQIKNLKEKPVREINLLKGYVDRSEILGLKFPPKEEQIFTPEGEKIKTLLQFKDIIENLDGKRDIERASYEAKKAAEAKRANQGNRNS